MPLAYLPALTAARMPVGSGFGAAARTSDLIDGLGVKRYWYGETPTEAKSTHITLRMGGPE